MSIDIELPVNYDRLSITERRIVRQKYTDIQNGNCKHCGMPLLGDAAKSILSKPIDKRRFPESFFKWPIHLHHDHKTGMTIGAVHNYCNAVLWQYHGE